MAESTNFYRRVGATVRAARLRAKLSQAALGARLGVTAGAVNRYEMGGRRVPLRDVPRIAAILGIAPAVLLGGSAGGRESRSPYRAGEVREESPMYGRSGLRAHDAARSYAASLTASRLRTLARRAGLTPEPDTATLRRYAELIAEDLTRQAGELKLHGSRRVLR